MIPDLATETLGALAADETLAARMKADVGLALAEVGLAPWATEMGTSALSLRRLPGGAEARPVWMAPTDGSQCTQAGCLTRERGCSSQYACSKTGPC